MQSERRRRFRFGNQDHAVFFFAQKIGKLFQVLPEHVARFAFADDDDQRSFQRRCNIRNADFPADVEPFFVRGFGFDGNIGFIRIVNPTDDIVFGSGRNGKSGETDKTDGGKNDVAFVFIEGGDVCFM